MTFKDLKKGDILYSLDKNNVSYKELVVSMVSIPRFENKVWSQPQMMVDVTLEGGQQPYVFPSDSCKAYAGTLMFTTDKNLVLEEVKALSRLSEQAIKDVERHQANILKCKDLLGDIDTTYKERLATEKRLDNIEMMLSKLVNNGGTTQPILRDIPSQG